jgi:hypothetical protein
MIKLLLDHGADESRLVENYRPGKKEFELLQPIKIFAIEM